MSANDAAHGRWLASLAARALYAGQTLDYLRLSRGASEACARAGDWRGATLHRHNVGHANLELGSYEAAERELREVLRLSERYGLANVVASAMNNLGAALGRLGRFKEAKQLLGDAISRLDVQGDMRMGGGARNHLAEVLISSGEVAAGAEEAERAIVTLSAVPPLLIQARGTLAHALLALGKFEQALSVAEGAYVDLGKSGSIADGEAKVRLVYAEALEHAGRRDQAARVIARARERLLARAEAMEDEELRRMFLEAVSENARTLELARAWGVAPS